MADTTSDTCSPGDSQNQHQQVVQLGSAVCLPKPGITLCHLHVMAKGELHRLRYLKQYESEEYEQKVNILTCTV